jgi:hypothetical protein
MDQAAETSARATPPPVCVVQQPDSPLCRTSNNKRIRKRKTVNYRVAPPRSKPHPKDHQFTVNAAEVVRSGVGLPTINRMRNHLIPCTTIVVALAMSWDCSRDRLRLQMMQLRTPGTKAITASDCKYTKGSLPHIDCIFSVDRGLRKVAVRIRAEKITAPQARVVVVLDHYWCEIRYYEEQYGMTWLQNGAHTLLSSGADEVLLPFDNGANIPSTASGMIVMLGGLIHPDVTVGFAMGRSNPLWAASECEEIREVLGDIRGGDNTEQSRKWLDPDRPFVRCTLKTRC